jgi:hypothetical protein
LFHYQNAAIWSREIPETEDSEAGTATEAEVPGIVPGKKHPLKKHKTLRFMEEDFPLQIGHPQGYPTKKSTIFSPCEGTFS